MTADTALLGPKHLALYAAVIIVIILVAVLLKRRG